MFSRSGTVILLSFILNHSVDSVDILDSASPALVDNGNRIPMDKSLTADYLKVAGDQGSDDAHSNYGMLVDTGNDTAMDNLNNVVSSPMPIIILSIRVVCYAMEAIL
jgi:hypothetical protein